MYEDKTFNNILNEMLKDSDVDTSEGSLMYEACAKMALIAEAFYLDLSRIHDNLNIEDMEEDVFEIYANDRGVARNEATPPKVLCTFNQEINIGERFTCNDYDYIITEQKESVAMKYEYIATCETTGTSANNNTGELEPIDYIDNWKGGNIEKIVIYGKNQEDIDSYKKRFKELRYNVQPFAGNKAAYKNLIREYGKTSGLVYDCVPLRTTDGEMIELWVVDLEYKPLSEEALAAVQEHIDPTGSSGEGDGMAPIGHKVILKTPQNVPMVVRVKVTLEDGYTWEAVKDSIKDKIDLYLYSVRSLWSTNEKTIVRISQIEYAVLSVKGVLDCTGATINGSEKNLEMDHTQIPIGGGVDAI